MEPISRNLVVILELLQETLKLCYAILDEHNNRSTIQEMDLEEWAKQLPMG